MKFVYHHRTQGRGAEGVHITSLVRWWRAAGHEVDLVSPPGVNPMTTAGTVPTDKGRTPVSGFSRLWGWASRRCPQVVFELLEVSYNLYALARLGPQLQKSRGAVYYERYAFYFFIGVMAAKWFRLPVLLEVNEVSGLKRARGQVLTFLANRIERAVFSRADAIFTVSSFLRDEIVRRGGSDSRVHVLPNAVDPDWLTRIPNPARVRSAYRLEGTRVIGFVGWFDQWDRLETLIDVAHDLRGIFPNLRVLLVGDGPVASTLRATADERGLQDIVIITGAVTRDQIPDFIAAMDVCVLPDSNPFGSPIVLFEFMGMGKAVIVPDLAPMTDVVEHGRTGHIVPSGDRTALHDAIRRLLADSEYRRQLGAHARDRVAKEHTWDVNARRVANIAEDLMHGNTRRS